MTTNPYGTDQNNFRTNAATAATAEPTTLRLASHSQLVAEIAELSCAKSLAKTDMPNMNAI